MAKPNVDEFYSASPSPEEDNTPEDTITVTLTRDDLALFKQMQRLRDASTTQFEDKTKAIILPTTSPYTPTKSSTGGDVTEREIESLIKHSRNAVQSDCKNTNPGETRSKVTPVNVSDTSGVEKSLVDSDIESHQDGNESNRDSPVSVTDAPGQAAPFNW